MDKDKVCYYCYGCNQLEDRNFKGVRNCKHFMPAVTDWQEKIRDNLRTKKKPRRF